MNSEKIILETARETLKIESNALNTLMHSLGGDFAQCVEAVFRCSGRLVLTGIGKSALVAQKIVATLNSTGTPALFMHAADAIHGDLGMIQQEDFILCISKSGETAEIKVLLPLVKHMGNKVIGMVCNPNSYLALQADYMLYLPLEREADPNNLAPTASTTVQMAMGDALATSLLALKGFSQNDFAKFHPGGTLGKQMYLKVANIFPRNEAPAVLPDTNLEDSIIEISSKRLGATAIVDKENQLLGIITDGDLRRMLTENKWDNHLTAKDIMTPNPITIRPEALAVEALNLMRSRSITQVVVVNENQRYLGMVHLHDLLREGII